MQAFTEFWNSFMSLGVFGLIGVSILLIYVLLLPKDSISVWVGKFVSKNVLWIGLILTLSASLSSLVYSDIIGYPPCLFCWYARIAFYPQVALFGLALVKKDRNILSYTLLLSTLGVLISGYHTIAEAVQYSPLPCAAGGVSCLTRYVYEYGFITIPVMSVIGFITLVLVHLVARRQSQAQ